MSNKLSVSVFSLNEHFHTVCVEIGNSVLHTEHHDTVITANRVAAGLAKGIQIGIAHSYLYSEKQTVQIPKAKP